MKVPNERFIWNLSNIFSDVSKSFGLFLGHPIWFQELTNKL